MKIDEQKGIYVWLKLWRTSRAVEIYAVKAVMKMGMDLDCVSDFAMLEILMHNGPLPVNEIGSRVLLKSASMTVAVDRLEKKGLVVRKNDPRDRRTRVVHLTAKGDKFIKKAWAMHATDMEKIVESLNEKERKDLVRVLKKFAEKAITLTEELENS